jgi:hypothetical protein
MAMHEQKAVTMGFPYRKVLRKIIFTKYSSVPTKDWKKSPSFKGLAVPKSDSL